MREEVRAKAVAVARSLAAASPGAAVELGQAPACSVVSPRGVLAARARSSPRCLSHTTPSSARRDLTGLQVLQGRLRQHLRHPSAMAGRRR